MDTVHMNTNDYFKLDDPHSEEIMGFKLNPSWWSRKWEYVWALNFVDPNAVVMDAGAGWSDRPFRNFLAQTCKTVYAVDLDERFLELPNKYDNMYYVVGNFEERLNLPELDRIFCISVLEDLIDYDKALNEFSRLLKPDGLLVLTFDVQYDLDKPLPKYPGVSWSNLWKAVSTTDLEPIERLHSSTENAIHNDEWNLTCYHCVLRKRPE